MSDTPRTDVVPGMMRCAKCNFVLVRTNLYVQSSTAGPGGNETEPCPNGCGPLWPLTWEQHARELGERLEQVHADFIVACEEREQRLFPVQGGPSIPWHLIAPWEEQAKRNHDQTLERLAERGGLDTNEAYCVMRGWSFIKIDDAAERLIALISVRSVNVRAEQAESALLACQAREVEFVEAINSLGLDLGRYPKIQQALSSSTGSKIMAVVKAHKSGWLVWSNEHRAWWRSNRSGYSLTIEEAGRYSLAEAVDCANTRSPSQVPDEVVVPSPELVRALEAK